MYVHVFDARGMLFLCSCFMYVLFHCPGIKLWCSPEMYVDKPVKWFVQALQSFEICIHRSRSFAKNMANEQEILLLFSPAVLVRIVILYLKIM